MSMVLKIILVVIGVLSLIALFFAKKFPIKIVYIIVIIAIIYTLFGGFEQIKQILKSRFTDIFVTPSSYTVNPGMDEEFTMKITNNLEYPLYKIEVKISLEDGDLPLEDILISATGNEEDLDKMEILPDNQLYKGPPKDSIRISIFNDNGKIRLKELYVRKKEGELYKLFFIEHMNPKETKSYPLRIHKGRMQKKSKLSFKIASSSREPVPTYKTADELKIFIPKEGNH